MHILVYVNVAIQMIFWGYAAWIDFKTQKIQVIPCILAGLGGSVVSAASGMSFLDIAGGICLGILFLGLAFFSGGSVGYGDGVSISCICAWVGGQKGVWLLTIAMFLLVILGGAMIAKGKATGKSRIPMLPVLYVSLWLVLAATFASA